VDDTSTANLELLRILGVNDLIENVWRQSSCDRLLIPAGSRLLELEDKATRCFRLTLCAGLSLQNRIRVMRFGEQVQEIVGHKREA